MNKKELLDQYFLDARHKVIDVAAFLDRLDRAEGDEDYRIEALRRAIVLLDANPDRAKRILESLSDPTEGPIEQAGEKGASGAWSGA